MGMIGKFCFLISSPPSLEVQGSLVMITAFFTYTCKAPTSSPPRYLIKQTCTLWTRSIKPYHMKSIFDRILSICHPLAQTDVGCAGGESKQNLEPILVFVIGILGPVGILAVGKILEGNLYLYCSYQACVLSFSGFHCAC